MDDIRNASLSDHEHRIADTSWTVARLVDRLKDRGEAPAVLCMRGDDVEVWSYQQLTAAVIRLAAGLCAAGLKAGESTAIYGPNSPAWITVALAVNAAGAIVVAIDELANDERACSIVRDSGAKRVFTTRGHFAELRRALGPEGVRIYLLDGSEDVPSAPSWASPQAVTATMPEFRSNQPACLLYTSGTTGPPKAVVLTHDNFGVNVQAFAAAGLVAPGDRVLIPLPLHHVYPYFAILASLETGVAIVLPQSVSGPDIAKALRVGRVSVVVGVPRLYQALIDGLEARIAARGRFVKWIFSLLLTLSMWSRRHLGLRVGSWLLGSIRRQISPDLRMLISGGARLEADLSWKLEAFGWETLAGYGLAETASVFTVNLPRRKQLGSAGTPLADGAVRITKADESGIGEIELRGRSVTSGYRNNPDATRAAFTGDGWFRTGDLGYLDAKGFLYVTGRAKEVIVLGGGKKVSPEELEKRYTSNPLIAEIALLERGGQLVGLVRPNPERLHDIGTFSVDHAVRVALAEAAQTLPAYERLAGWAITTRTLPRTRLGKCQRFLLPKLYDQAQLGINEAPQPELSDEDRQLLKDPIAGEAWSVISKRYAAKRPTLDAHLALDLGVDSLEWMSLSLELEAKFHVFLSQEEMAQVESVRDLLRATTKAAARPATKSLTHVQRTLADRERWLRPRSIGSALMGFALFAVNKILMRVFFRLRAYGTENLPASGSMLFTPNHVSDLDPLALAASLSLGRLRRVYWAGDVARLFGNSLQRALCRAVHLFPVEERMPESATEMAAFVLSQGNSQVWFPEGWRSPDGRLQPFRSGIGTLLIKTKALAVPVYISGTFEAMPRTRRWPRLHPTQVVFGGPLDVEMLQSRGVGETAEERVASALQAEVRALATTIGDDV